MTDVVLMVACVSQKGSKQQHCRADLAHVSECATERARRPRLYFSKCLFWRSSEEKCVIVEFIKKKKKRKNGAGIGAGVTFRWEGLQRAAETGEDGIKRRETGEREDETETRRVGGAGGAYRKGEQRGHEKGTESETLPMIESWRWIFCNYSRHLPTVLR